MLLPTGLCLSFTAATFAALLLAAGTVPPQEISNIPMAWQITQGINPSTGNRHCTVVSLGGDVTAGLSQEENAGPALWSVRVGFGNQPGSLRYIRINRQYYTTDKESFRGKAALQSELQQGSTKRFVTLVIDAGDSDGRWRTPKGKNKGYQDLSFEGSKPA